MSGSSTASPVPGPDAALRDRARPRAGVQLRMLTRADAHWHIDGLAALLRDGVDGGASLGWLAPLTRQDAQREWERLQETLSEHELLWAACDGECVVGCVRLSLATMPNARHRATLERLLVASDRRGRGIGRALVATAEREALQAGRSLVVADVETASDAEWMLRHLGWLPAGTLPDYAAAPDGRLRPATRLFRRLGADDGQ